MLRRRKSLFLEIQNSVHPLGKARKNTHPMGEKYERNSGVANPQKLYKQESLPLNNSELALKFERMSSNGVRFTK